MRRPPFALALAALFVLSAPVLAPRLVRLRAEELSEKEFKRLQFEANDALQRGDLFAMQETIAAIASDNSQRAVDTVVTIAVQTIDHRVYNSVTKALAGISGAEPVLSMIEEATGKRGDLRRKILFVDSFALRKDAATAKALGRSLASRQAGVVRAALQALEHRRPLEAVEGLLDVHGKLTRAKELDGAMGERLRKLLLDLTGRHYDSTEDWRRYWAIVKDKRIAERKAEEERQRLEEERLAREAAEAMDGLDGDGEKGDGDDEDGEPAAAGEKGDGDEQDADKEDGDGGILGGGGGDRKTGERDFPGRTKPEFFGREIPSDRLVFVIDVSGSMAMGDKIGEVKSQLSKLVKDLPESTEFTIIAFSNGVKNWSNKLRRANKSVKANALSYIAQLQATGGTFSLQAMKAAFEVKGEPDAILFLSDGAPTERDKNGAFMPPLAVMAEITALNRYRKWRIDTFGFSGPGQGFEEFMQELARENGGEYTDLGR